jgi:hypothetical protein
MPTGKKYYGSRVANRCEPEQDLWNEYFSSSKLVKILIKEQGKESFIAKVRKTFDNINDAHEYEQRFLHRVKAVEKEEWLNQAYAYGPFYNTASGKFHHNYGKPWPPERVEQKRKDMTGERNPRFGKEGGMKNKHHDTKTIETISKFKQNWWDVKKDTDPTYNKGSRHPRFGKPVLESQRQKKYKAVTTPLGKFVSIKHAAKAHKCGSANIVNKCRRGTPGYFYS